MQGLHDVGAGRRGFEPGPFLQCLAICGAHPCARIQARAEGRTPVHAALMPGLTLNPPPYVQHARLIAWVANLATLCKPKRIEWCDGS